MVQLVTARTAEMGTGTSRVEEAVGRCRLLRQLPEQRTEARQDLEAILRSHPDDPGALCQMGAYLLSWRDRPDDRARAVEITGGRPSREPKGLTATLLLTLATADPGYLRKPPSRGCRGR